jgi:non-canonical purine NTP pyrophosphatase (RdgB/HAM1 family)
VPYILASANPDKAAEIREILHDVDLLPRPQDIPDVDETGDTLEDNARLKAVALANATGLSAIADDTGLFVDALPGELGVRSARYAGEDATYEDNTRKLFAALEGLPLEQRGAYFRLFASSRGSIERLESSCEQWSARQRRAVTTAIEHHQRNEVVGVAEAEADAHQQPQFRVR